MKRVIVTGASGFLGRRCVPRLRERGFDVIAVSRRDLDLLDRGATARFIAGIRADALLHLAWYTQHGLYWNASENFEWLDASIHLLRRFVDAGGSRFTGAGTCAEYSWDGSVCDEWRTPCHPASIYGACKLSLGVIAGTLPVSNAWGRLFYLYGADEHPRRLVRSIITSLKKGQPAQCTSGEQIRDFLYADDAADALVSLLDSDVSGPVNIASGRGVRVAEVAREIARQLGREELLRLGAIAASPNDPRRIEADTKRLNDEVQWRPRYDLQSGIAATLRESEN